MRCEIEALEKARSAGLTLTVNGDRLRYRAPAGTVTPELLAELRRHKAEILAALRRETKVRMERQRWGLPPSCEIPMIDVPPHMTQSDRELVIAHMSRQLPGVIRWTLNRADEYADGCRDWAAWDCDLAACLDVIRWERQTDDVDEIVDLLRDLEAMAEQWGR